MTESMQTGPIDGPPTVGVRHYAGEPVLTDGRPPQAVILPVPYDGTSTWGKGADKGPEALFEALENMELFDIETNSEVHRAGIAVLEALPLEMDGVAKSPEEVCADVRGEVGDWLGKGTLPVLVGGGAALGGKLGGMDDGMSWRVFLKNKCLDPFGPCGGV